MKKETLIKTGNSSAVKPESSQRLVAKIREYGEAILIALVLALFIRTFVVQAFKIPSGSMEATLQIGDHILVNKFIYGVKIPFTHKTIVPGKEPRRGDIIVFEFPKDPKKDFIKRVIGEPGDVIEIRNKKILINNKPIEENYGFYLDPSVFPESVRPRDNFGPFTVPPQNYFVMGDNRDHSFDSRFWGTVDFSSVKGKAFIIYWSWDKENFGVRWKRIGRVID
ncbi:MAG: signal peptidase I [Desulfobacteria bacterium]|jgi:signal peptidase I|nr:signal peptidase I [Pseudomonadota bacterium]MDL1977721.1 signal peptidase I [Deltaproteobacteria bacterium]OEU57008.1 MAG: signal peptidase I [Desulfobacterales bacterium C00003106]OEU60610.1 MAG: signal peptidase I [Desulfobacterales bacterium C00003104]